jgi:hypothetical protein
MESPLGIDRAGAGILGFDPAGPGMISKNEGKIPDKQDFRMEQTPQDYQRRMESLGKWSVRITSYKLGKEYHCTVDNVDPGATIARAHDTDRRTAEALALQLAKSSMKLS